MDEFKPLKVINCDVVVMGGGAAGCFAAIKAKEAGASVVLVDKGYVSRSGSSPFLAGSTNVCLPEDNKEEWLKEIVERGEYLNDQEWVKIQLEETYPLALELEKWANESGRNVFRKDESGKFYRRKARGNINTMTCVVDALALVDTLRWKVEEQKIPIYERVMVTDFITVEDQIRGIIGFNYRTGVFYHFRAKTVILAAGGCGFKGFFMGHKNLTGESFRMAYEVGAELRNLDQAMSNTTAKQLDIHGLSLMVGSGGKFRNGNGEEFMLRYDPKVGSRARLTKLTVSMAREVDAGRGPIYMDLTGVSKEDQRLLREVLPEGFKAFDSLGINPFEQQVEWMPAFMGTLAHGGGVHIDTKCASTIPGLYAVGDASCTPEHGTWSITGLNISFCIVSGARAGKYAAEFVKQVSIAESADARESELVELTVGQIKEPLARKEGLTADQVVSEIQSVMIPYHVAYVRNESRLLIALEQIENIKSKIDQIRAEDLHDLVKANEVKSMIIIAEMILRSVLFRKESRGFVYREDYPETDNENWLKWVIVQKSENDIHVFAKDFPMPYIKPTMQGYSWIN